MERPKKLDTTPAGIEGDSFPIVGVGASAGGVQALTGFLKGLDRNCGVGVVVVTHLSPTRPSLLHEVLGNVSPYPVEIARDGARVEKNRVYVMPENAVLGMRGRDIALHQPTHPRDHKPIDAFFESMAAEIGASAVGVVLSGGDGDGTLGVMAIRAHGGLTFAQAPDAGTSRPQQPSMPESAIATGMVDYVLAIEDMGTLLAKIARGETPPRTDQAPGSKVTMKVICELLLKQTGHDFSGYKLQTFQRRIARHMHALGIVAEVDYIARLVANSDDVACLFRDLLISVTSFFRDPLAFEAMVQDVIPRLFLGKKPGDKVRVWIPGCATGQEVYSIAMLLREHADTMRDPPKVQIFGTDIDEQALEVARIGRYPRALMDGVSAERRRRFFDETDGRFRVRRELREDCVFAEHSVVRDPAFSRLDLISCRNLLIYFDERYQRRVIPIFHRALREGGFLLLGRSEFAGQHLGLFEPADRTHRIFRRVPGASAASDVSTSVPILPMLTIPERIASPLEATKPFQDRLVEPAFGSLDPAYLIIGASGELRGASANATAYLDTRRPADVLGDAGRLVNKATAIEDARDQAAHAATPVSKLEPDLDGSIGHQITLVINEALAAGEPVRHSKLLHVAQRDRMIGIEAEPLVVPEGLGGLSFITLTDLGSEASSSDAHLEAESRALILWRLVETRQRLRSTIVAYEATLEEMKSANEELLSTNEESQSVNEEVEASKEELQALNEEMNSVNADLISKVEALDRSHADLKNLFESTQIATVFLDGDSRIRTYTPAAQKLFRLIPSDEGRPLSDLAGHVAFPGLTGKIDAVMRDGAMLEYQAARPDLDAHFLVRIFPYEEADRPPNGVVLTFLDVTQLADARAHIEKLAQAEAHQRVLIGELNHRVKNMLAVVIGIATLTVKTSPSPEAFYESLIGRLRAMSRAYELLSRENWVEATVADLVVEETAPFDPSCVKASGPDVRLGPDEALAISVVLHELATNAVKYGALSRSTGLVSITWNTSLGDDHLLEIVWRESGGPLIAGTPERGFGLDLIENEITSQFGGAVDVIFDPGGLLARISFPISRVRVSGGKPNVK